jgi:hypothetical protein
MCYLNFTPYLNCQRLQGRYTFYCTNRLHEQAWLISPSLLTCPRTVRTVNPGGVVCECCRVGRQDRGLASNGAYDCNWERFLNKLRDVATEQRNAIAGWQQEEEQEMGHAETRRTFVE